MQEKIHWKPGTMVYPLPAAIISCGTKPEDYNLITISWIGTICSDPPMLSISVRPERHSHKLIKEAGEFVVNLTNAELAQAADFCGVRSGKDINKWNKTGLSPYPSKFIKTPQIKTSPVSIECVIKNTLSLGSHDMFIAEVVNVSVLPNLLNKDGKYELGKNNLVSYVHGNYYNTGDIIGKFGYSVEKKKKTK